MFIYLIVYNLGRHTVGVPSHIATMDVSIEFTQKTINAMYLAT